MLNKYAFWFCHLANDLADQRRSLYVLSLMGKDAIPPADPAITRIRGSLPGFRAVCAAFGLTSVVREMDRISISPARAVLVTALLSDLDHLAKHIEDDLDSEQFYHVQKNKVPYWEGDTSFLQSVAMKFPQTAIDHLQEAGRCFALGRNSASVYHLMGALDISFKAIAKTLNAKIDFDDPTLTWGNIITEIETGVKAKMAKAPRKWGKLKPIYDDLVLDIRTIKKTIRNPTAHYRATYDEDGAFKAFNAVRTFMEDYAKTFNTYGR